MEFNQLIQERRSIRKFTNQPIEPAKIDKLIETLLQAPSSKASFPCQFFMVKDSLINEKLAESKPHGSAFLKEAPLVVVLAADPNISDVWIEDASIAASFVMLETVNLGLGGCWVQIRNRNYSEELSSSEYVKNLLNMDDQLEVLALYGIGYPDKYQHRDINLNISPVSILG